MRAPYAFTALLVIFAARLDAAPVATAPASQPSEYSRLLQDCKLQITAKHYDQAVQDAMRAMDVDDSRYEAYALCGAALFEMGKTAEAEGAVKRAVARAPEAKRHALNDFLAKISSARPPTQSPSVANAPTAEQRLALTELQSISEDLRKASSDEQRKSLLREMFDKSGESLKTNPKWEAAWEFRAIAALELDKEAEAVEAAKTLKDLGALTHGTDAQVKLLARIDRAYGPAAKQRAKEQAELAKRKAELDVDDRGALYRSWARYAQGTTVKVKNYSKDSDAKADPEIFTTWTLERAVPDAITLTAKDSQDGEQREVTITPQPAEWGPYRNWTSVGTEAIKVGDREYPCEIRETDSNSRLSRFHYKMWLCPLVPGLWLRSELRIYNNDDHTSSFSRSEVIELGLKEKAE